MRVVARGNEDKPMTSERIVVEFQAVKRGKRTEMLGSEFSAADSKQFTEHDDN